MSDVISIGETYLYSGYIEKGTTGELQLKPQSLEPVQDLVLLTSSLSEKSRTDQLWPWVTDGSGKLYEINSSGGLRSSPVHYLGNKRKFYVPPPGLLLEAWAAHRQEWPKKLAEQLLLLLKPEQGVELEEQRIGKRHLKLPSRDSSEEADIAYRKWYDSQPEQIRLHAFIFPKTRGLAMLFSKSFDLGNVEVTLPGGAKLSPARIERQEESFSAVVLGNAQSLPVGLYSFEVTPPPQAAKAFDAALGPSGKYRLKEMVRFPITNFAGEFDVIACDPVSVEEAMLAQFPSLLGHLALMTKKRALYPDLEVNFGTRDVPPAVKNWAERLTWAHSKAGTAVGLVNAKGHADRAKTIGGLIMKAVETQNTAVQATKDALALAFGLDEAKGAWKDVAARLSAGPALDAAQELVLGEIPNTWERYRWAKYMKAQYAGSQAKKNKILKLAQMDKEDLRLVLKAGVPQKFTKLQKLVGREGALAVTKGLVAGQTALDVINAAAAFNDVSESIKSAEERRGDLKSLCEQIDSKLGGVACREALGNLERARAAVVAADMKLSDDEQRALQAALDVTLGVLCTVGIGEAAIGAYVLAMTAGSLLMSAAELFDRLAFEGFCKDWLAMRKSIYDLARASDWNQKSMASLDRSTPAGSHELQFRLRAEALTGLAKLLLRASTASKSREEFQERVRKYKIKEYVESFVLRSGWQFPLSPLTPVSLDSQWLYTMVSRWAPVSAAEIADLLGYTRPIQAGAQAMIPGASIAMFVLDQVLSKHATAQFHETFPIHRIESDSFETFADLLGVDCPEIGIAQVEYTCIYYRPRGSSKESDWRQIQEGAIGDEGKLPLLSPYDQIRILVVFEKSVQGGPYPISFQLERVDGLNLTGPVYRELTQVLGAELLPGEAKYKGRVGCIFYPFYNFGVQSISGIKPMARMVSTLGLQLYRKFHFLDDMRYSFELRVGSRSRGVYVALNGRPSSEVSATADSGRVAFASPSGDISLPRGAAVPRLDELRVGFTGRPDEDRLLSGSFLESRAETFSYPPLFLGENGAGPWYVRIGKNPYLLPSSHEEARLVFSHFDWASPVEFVVLAWSERVAEDAYRNAGLDYSRMPMEIALAFEGGSVMGPTYRSSLNYLGTIFPRVARFEPGWREPSESVSEWARQVLRNADSLKRMSQAVGDGTRFDLLHLWAAHFRLDYFTPNGHKLVQSLRPFGKVLQNRVGSGPEEMKYYRIGIRNVWTVESSGIKQEKLEAPRVDFGLRSEYECHFRAPLPGEGPFAGLSAEDLRKWVEERASKRDPWTDLVKDA